MPPSRSKYKRTTDLYTQGIEVTLKDGNVVFMRALNPLERQEALSDAAAARGRLMMALEEIDSDEMAKVRGAFYNDGREGSIQIILNAKTGEMLARIASEVRDEEEWREKLDIISRGDELRAREPEDIERKLLEKVEQDWLAAVNERYDNERDAKRVQYQAMGDEELIHELRELWKERRGSDAGEKEFRVAEIFFAVRCCDGVQTDGEWDHGPCDGHKLQLYETKRDVAQLPDELAEVYIGALNTLNMTVREAKNSDRQQSSSVSSPLPDEEGESTPSTPTETLAAAPGTSTQLSSTP